MIVLLFPLFAVAAELLLLRPCVDVWTRCDRLACAENTLRLDVRLLVEEALRSLRWIRLAYGGEHLREVLLRDRCLRNGRREQVLILVAVLVLLGVNSLRGAALSLLPTWHVQRLRGLFCGELGQGFGICERNRSLSH